MRSPALKTKSFVAGSVFRALVCPLRVVTKHFLAPLLAVTFLATEEAANAAQTNQAADRRGDNCFQRMPSWRGVGQCLRQFIKFRWLHLGALLPERDCKEKAKLVKPFFSTISDVCLSWGRSVWQRCGIVAAVLLTAELN
jgi:hypothetical protein